MTSVYKLIKKSSEDGATKYLWQLMDNNTIESVLLEHDDKICICISSQIGCPLGCKFCFTGQSGFVRNLSHFEIYEQVYKTLIDSHENGIDLNIDRVLFMGMGEPLLNFQAVSNAIDRIKKIKGFERVEFFISTVGLIPEIYKLAEERPSVKLWISLHAPNDEKRNKIIPINRKYPIKELLLAGIYYAAKSDEKVRINYVLIKDFNDSIKDAYKLAKLVRDKSFRLQIAKLNPCGNYQSPSNEKIVEFVSTLEKIGIKTEFFRSKGTDILAACGQLRQDFLRDSGILVQTLRNQKFEEKSC